jgi:hypothetical protein
MSVLERAHHAYLDTGETLRAVRCAFWVGMFSAVRGEMARSTGWFGRAQRLLERDCVERGYLLAAVMMQQEASGHYEAAHATTVDAIGIGERFGDPDLVALSLREQGRMLVELARCDLHVHSVHSTDTGSFALRRAGLGESNTEPERVYDVCVRRGMTFMTVSDHNTLDGALRIAHPPRTFLSVGVTTPFPEDDVPLHVLVWGLSEEGH